MLLINAFKDDLYEMIRFAEFRHTRNAFQKQLSEDIKQMKESNSVYVSADKTTNMYKLSVDNYNKILTRKPTKKVIHQWFVKEIVK